MTKIWSLGSILLLHRPLRLSLKSYRHLAVDKANYALFDQHEPMRSMPMKTLRLILVTTIYTCPFVAVAASVQAEQIQTTGTPGSPGATTTINGKQLPPPDPKFGGVIKDGALQSKAWWAIRCEMPRPMANLIRKKFSNIRTTNPARSHWLSS
jgi:hypothetical protein